MSQQQVQGFSGVVKIIEKQCGEKRAVKHFNQKNLGLVKKEIEFLNILEHQNIVKMINHDEFSIEFEYMDIELYDLVDAQKFNENTCVYIAKEILNGLIYLKQKDIVHADLKLQNIMLKKVETEGLVNYEVKLIDFGLSKYSNQIQKGFYSGTEGFMAPEMLMKREIIPQKLDVFALGVCLFQLITAFPPYYCKATEEDALYKYIIKGFNSMYWRILRDRFNLQFSDSFRNLFDGMMDPNPETRFTLEQVINHPWMQQEVPTQEIFVNEIEKRINIFRNKQN